MERLAHGLARLSRGDLTVRIVDPFPEGYGHLRTDFNGAMDHLDQAMGQASSPRSAAVGRSSDEITAAADNTARRSEQQAASLEETAAALDEITATVRRASQGANDASPRGRLDARGRRALGRGGARRRRGHERHRAVLRSRSARSSG
jgi:methyl-accepting chemotaxis protein